MKFLVIPIETLKEFDTEWEYRRKSNDGTKAILHKEIYDELVPQVMTLNLVEDEESTPNYPFPLVNGDDLDTMEDFKHIETTNELYK